MKLFWKIVLASAYVAMLGYLVLCVVVDCRILEHCRYNESHASYNEKYGVPIPEITGECMGSDEIEARLVWEKSLAVGMALVGVGGVIVWATKRHRRNKF